MSHITEIALENYRSFRSACCRLSPFTLIVGANNAGKTNLLKAVQDAAACESPAESMKVLSAARHHASEAGVRTEISTMERREEGHSVEPTRRREEHESD